jgi:ferritin
MKINKKVEDVLNKQVNAEFWSAYLYLSMSAWCENKGLKGFANWMRVQFQEETTHALKIYDFVLNRSGEIRLEPIAAVDKTWNNLLSMFEETYKHECLVTDLINNCYEVAESERDHATSSMLKWFIDEQTEEERNVVEIIDQIKLMGENGEGIYHLDKELATRIFVDPTKTIAP